VYHKRFIAERPRSYDRIGGAMPTQSTHFMTKSKPTLPSLVLALLTVSTAQAQVTLDVSKITCEQLLQNKVAAPRVLGDWLSGYYNGKRNNTLDTQAVEKNCSKMMNYCRSHLNMAVMQAVESVLGAGFPKVAQRGLRSQRNL